MTRRKIHKGRKKDNTHLYVYYVRWRSTRGTPHSERIKARNEKEAEHTLFRRRKSADSIISIHRYMVY